MSELTKEQLLEYVKKQKLKMKKLETEIASLKEKAEPQAPTSDLNSQEEIASLRSNLNLLEDQLSDRDKEISSLSKSIEEAEDEKIKIVALKDAEIASLTHMNEKSLQSAESDKDGVIETLETTIAAQHAQIESLQLLTKDIDSLQSDLIEAKAKESAAQAEIERLNATIDQISVSAAQLEEGNKSYTSKMGEFEALIKDLESKLAAFEAGEDALRSDLKNREAATNSINEQLSASLEIIVCLKESAESQKTIHDKTAAELIEANSELQAKTDALADALQRSKDLESKLSDLSQPQATTSAAPAPAPVPGPPVESTGSNVGKKKGKNNKKGKGKGGADSAEVADTTAGETEVATAAEVAVEVSSEPASDGGSSALVQQLEARLEEATQHCISIEQKHADQLVALEAQLEQVLSAERIASADSAALTARLESLSSEWAESQTKLAELTNQNVELDGDKARISMQLASVSEELVAERTRLSDELAVVSERLAVASSGAESSTQALLDELSMLKLRHDHLEESHAALVAREAAVSEELNRSQAELSTHLDSIEHLKRQVATLQEEVLASQQDQNQLKNSVSEKDGEITRLREELTVIRNAGDSSSSQSSAEIVALREQILSLESQLHEIQAADAAKGEELTALKETSVLSEGNNKKLLAKLKSKMKECTDLSAELSTAKDTASKSATAEAASVSLSRQIAELESSLKTKIAEKAELEGKLKSTNDTVIAGEERISALLREKNKLQEDLFGSLHKMESVSKESHEFKTERDLARQQYLDNDTKLQSLSSSSREKIDMLTVRVAELTTLVNSQAANISSLNETLALSNSEITTLKENATGMTQANSKLKAMTATVETLKTQLQETKTDAEAKAEANADRIKKLKQLLAKVNAALQEKDVRLNQLQSANDRAKKFNIVARIGIVPPQDPAGEELQWCLIYEHRNQAGSKATGDEDTNSPPQYRWIEARLAHKWMAEGSTLVGAWPQPVQETWAAELSAVRARLESEKDDLSSKFEEVTSQFQTYKVRAQTALKRIGNEDRNERQKVLESENAEIEKLRGVVQDLREKESDFSALISEKDRSIAQNEAQISELRAEVDKIQGTLIDSAQSLEASERKISQLNREIESLQGDNRTMKEQYEVADRNNRERRVQQLRAEEEDALRTAMKTTLTDATASPPRSQSVGPPAEEVQDNTMIDSIDNSHSSAPHLTPLSSPSTETSGAHGHHGGHGYHHAPHRGISRENSHSTQHSSHSPRSRPSAVEAALSSEMSDTVDNKLLLFQQADHMLRDSLAILRQENSQLMVEINELKNDFGLREDQVQTLKEAVRELESSLCREKEFNAENRRINADYLVNILRNFLMSTEPSERAKLVPVLCQILHLRVDETRIITEKWAVRTGGLVGWLMPPRPASTGPAAAPRYQQHATGMSIDRGDGAAKSSTGDLSYDPVTGAGIDVNSY